MTPNSFDPVLAAELEALVPPDPDARGDWRDVEHRAERSPSRRPLLIAAALVLAALLLVVPALAALRYWVEFAHAPAAPAPVVEQFDDLAREAPPGLDPGAIAAETRRLEIVDAAGTPSTLYLSPSRDGGYCLELPGFGGPGCNNRGTPFAVGLAAHSLADTSAVVYGAVLDPGAATVTTTTADGRTTTTPLTRVGPPIDASFFVVPVDDPQNALPILVEVRSADGTATTSRTIPRAPSP